MSNRVSAPRRLPSRLRRFAISSGLLVLAATGLVSTSASAQSGGSPEGDTPATCERVGCIDVVAVDGLIDSIEADFIIDTLASARAADGVVGVVLQFDSGGVAVDAERINQVAAAIAGADVPVSVWIGPSGSSTLGGAVELVQVADSSGISPGSRIGDAGAQVLDPAEFGELLTGPAAVARTQVLSGQAAVDAGVVDRFSPTVGDHIVNLDGVRTETRTEDGQRRQVPITIVRFSKLPLFVQLFHTVASPSVAYLLLAIGLGLLLFEFFTAGVGVAGVVGAMCLVLGAYGTAELPRNGWALAAMVLGVLGCAIDVQTGIPRAWTVIGMSAFTVGSVFVFTEFRPTWIALIVGIVGMAVVMFSGMPAMVRTRFATPTIGREQMVGELGTAIEGVEPEGTVQVLGGLWRARTNRATPIPAGEPVRVVGIDGLVLEVEPETGGAIDYREMRTRRRAAAADDGSTA